VVGLDDGKGNKYEKDACDGRMERWMEVNVVGG
jgi:hypothetical protein